MSASSQLAWSPVAIMPNIEILGEIGNEFGVICSQSNQKLGSLFSEFSELRTFAKRFSDAFGVQHNPAFVLLSHKFEKRHQDSQAFLAFRNAVAVSLTTLGMSKAIAFNSSHSLPIYSDSFDCYPWMLGKDLRDLFVNSAALSGFHEVRSFKGQSSPQLSHRVIDPTSNNDVLLKSLMNVWSQTFLKRRNVRKNIKIFRSLEMAYDAGRVPFQYAQTDTDHGRLIALWVSALEILAHPGNKSNVSRKDVLDLLSGYDAAFKTKLRLRRYTVRHGKTPKRVDLLEKTYNALFDLRNDYLHGNPRSFGSLIPRGYTKNLLHAAPALYRICLFSKLAISQPEFGSINGLESILERMQESIEYDEIRSTAENAILAVRYGND